MKFAVTYADIATVELKENVADLFVDPRSLLFSLSLHAPPVVASSLSCPLLSCPVPSYRPSAPAFLLSSLPSPLFTLLSPR
eukprot:750863-Hanusia_phi.AAC.2